MKFNIGVPLEQKTKDKIDQKKARSKALMMKAIEDPNYRHKSYENGFVFFKGKWIFVKSRWEANIMAYAEYLKQIGHITEWEYEPQTFWFKGIKRGVTNYKPDFRITRTDGTKYWWEVKGYMTKKDELKLQRMKRYHPLVEIEVIGQDRYKSIKESKSLIPGWDQPLKRKSEISQPE